MPSLCRTEAPKRTDKRREAMKAKFSAKDRMELFIKRMIEDGWVKDDCQPQKHKVTLRKNGSTCIVGKIVSYFAGNCRNETVRMNQGVEYALKRSRPYG